MIKIEIGTDDLRAAKATLQYLLGMDNDAFKTCRVVSGKTVVANLNGVTFSDLNKTPKIENSVTFPYYMTLEP